MYSDTAERRRIPIKFRHKEERVPQSLFHLCLKYVANNLDTICTATDNGFMLYDGLALPSEICDPLIEVFQDTVGEVFDRFAYLFKDVTKTNLRSVNLHGSTITDAGLKYLLRHNLHELALKNCEYLTIKSYSNIFKHAVNLRSLTIGPNVNMTPYSNPPLRVWGPLSLGDTPLRINKKAPNLKHLMLRAITESLDNNNSDNKVLGVMVDKVMELRTLDLSYCLRVGNLSYLCKLTNLHTLILFDVPNLQNPDAIINICSLQSLV